jgi:hypothetical protein
MSFFDIFFRYIKNVETGTGNMGGLIMNVDTNEGPEAAPIKRYHAPEFTTLGPIQSVVKTSAGGGADLGEGPGASGSTAGS